MTAGSGPGQQIGAYRLLGLLGKGGMGEVHLALDTRLGRNVAIKFLSADSLDDERARKRLLREARAAATLDHPNICAIHEIGEESGRSFIVMQCVEGETLAEVFRRKRLEVNDVLDLAIQIADALAEAHAHSIIHRDIKPANIIIDSRGQAKVLDFGLAKVLPGLTEEEGYAATATIVSTPGLVVGTVPYMSPEQVRGETLDERTDIFSLGVLLYEALSGQQPFTRPSASETLSAVLTHEPPALESVGPDASSVLQPIVARCLMKDRAQRYQTAAAVRDDLRELNATIRGKPPSTASSVSPRWRTSRWRTAVLTLLLLSLVGAGGWMYRRNTQRAWAHDAVRRVEDLAQREDFFAAYDLADQIKHYLPNDPALTRLMGTIADDLSVVTNPPGAQVYIRRFAADESVSRSRQLLGVTPINHRQIARGAYIVSIEKDGYAALERSVSGVMMQLGGIVVASPPIQLKAALIEAPSVPARMAFVPGGDYRMVSWSRPTAERVRLDSYLIDKYEVTNREFKEFISAGGYLKKEFWRHPLIKDGRQLAWDEGVREFKDRTGLPAPRNWTNQDVPEGKAEHPVTDISWYEAAAYAAFRDKELPTVFQWEKAARDGLTMAAGAVMPWGLLVGGVGARANFSTRGTMPVESLAFGMSPYGCYHMAGNVAEWCRNKFEAGFATTGGSWDDDPYFFGRYGNYPGVYGSDKLGFRCVRNAPGATGDQGAMPLAEDDVPVFTPVNEARFLGWHERYRYAQSPLDARIVETKETDDWRREKITYVGAEGDRAIAYLYLPKHHPPPWQMIQFVPAGDVFALHVPLPTRVEVTLAPFIKSGRAVLAVVLKGFSERDWPTSRTPPRRPTVEYRDEISNWLTDERRGLDYAATRTDLDPSRVAYIASSVDGGLKLGLPAIDARYRSVVLVGAALYQADTELLPEINPINLVPYIRAPKLMIQGRYDEDSRLKTQAEPLHKLLREPKRIFLYDGGHAPALELFVPTVNGWLDETMGPVQGR